MDFLFDGKSLKDSGEELRLLSLRVNNVGRKGLGKSDFDDKEPFGISLAKGRILSATLQNASSDYLKRNVAITSLGETALRFDPVILDAGEWFGVEILVASKAGESPQISATGKIVGITSEIPVADIRDEASQKSLARRVFEADSWTVHAARLPAYAIGFLLAIVVLVASVAAAVAPFAFISDLLSKRKRRRLVQEYSYGRALSDIERTLLYRYESQPYSLLSGYAFLEGLRRVGGVIADGHRTIWTVGGEAKIEDVDKYVKSRLPIDESEAETIIQVADGKAVIDPTFEDTLGRLVEFLKSKGGFDANVPDVDLSEAALARRRVREFDRASVRHYPFK